MVVWWRTAYYVIPVVPLTGSFLHLPSWKTLVIVFPRFSEPSFATLHLSIIPSLMYMTNARTSRTYQVSWVVVRVLMAPAYHIILTFVEFIQLWFESFWQVIYIYLVWQWPQTEPCGTPLIIYTQFDKTHLVRVFCSLPFGSFFVQWRRTFPLMPA